MGYAEVTVLCGVAGHGMLLQNGRMKGMRRKRAAGPALLLALWLVCCGAGVAEETVTYYFPCGGMSTGAMLDTVDDYAYHLGTEVRGVGLDLGLIGLEMSPAALERMLGTYPLVHSEEEGLLYMQRSPGESRLWTMSDVYIDCAVAIDQPSLSPLYAYQVTVDPYTPGEMHQFFVQTEMYDPIGDNLPTLALYSAIPDEDAPAQGPQALVFSFPAQDRMVFHTLAADDNEDGLAKFTIQTVDLSGLGVGEAMTVEGDRPWAWYTPFVITIEKTAVLR